MEHDFDKGYWDAHWQQRTEASGSHEVPANPHLVRTVSELVPGTALEAGCGEGAEAIWLARAGWRVTAVDVASDPLTRAADRATRQGLGDAVRWVQADLTTWQPEVTFDLVTTHYAHPAMPQLAFYDRISRWVAPGGSLLVVGHLHTDGADHEHGAHHEHGADHEHGPPAEASVTAASITDRLDPTAWEIVTAEELTRTVGAPGSGEATLHDVVVRAVRRPGAPPR